MSFLKVPARYLFNKSIQVAFNTSPPSQPSSTAGPTALDADTQSDDAAFYSQGQGSAFKPQYSAPLRHPQDDVQAQRLYNHIRTVAWYLDALPLLGKKLLFDVGVDSIIGLIPGVGDYFGLMLGIYQIYLCCLFGLPPTLIFWMFVNIIIDCFLGLIPIVGDLLDVAFKANLRNLKAFEGHLKESRGKCRAGQFYIPFPSNECFLPKQNRGQRSDGFFGFGQGRQEGNAGPRATSTEAGVRPTSFQQRTANRGDDDIRAFPLALPLSSTTIDDVIASGFAREGMGIEGENVPVASGSGQADVEGYSIPEADEQIRPRSSMEPFEIEGLVDRDRAVSSASMLVSPSLGGRRSIGSMEAEWIVREGSNSTHSPRRSREYFDDDDTPHPTEEDALIGTSPESSQSVHRRGRDPIMDIGVGSAQSSMSASRSEGPADTAQTERPRPVSAVTRVKSSTTTSNNDSSGDTDPLIRRGISWHESLTDPWASLDPISRRERRIADSKAQWRRRRTMYFVVYSAIFCVAYITSLDANTGYLYLNFACSEYGALASFSTVAIVQQMVFAVAKPPIAKLSDVFGRAEAYVLSLVLYVSGYAIVASTASLRSLIGGICLQSAGNTGVQVLQSIIIADTTTAKWRGLVIGIVNLPYLINFAVAGPLVDLVMRKGSWRMGYALWIILVPVAATPLLITLAIGQRRARRVGLAMRNPLTGKGVRIALKELSRELDTIGLLLFTGGWLLILLPLTLAGHGERSQGIPPQVPFVFGAALLGLFCWWETKAVAPILPYQFLANRAVVCVCVVGVLDFASFYISWTFLSSFIQIIKGWDQTRTGYFATTQNVTSTVTGIVVGSLMAMTRRFKTLLVGGLVIRLIGVSIMIRYRNADDPTIMLVLCQLLQGIGGGSIAITMQVAVQVKVRHSDVAIVTALELLTTEIGAAIGSATAGWMFKSYLPASLVQHLPGMDAEELQSVYGSLQAALKYPIGSPERTGIMNAWVEVMRFLSISATVVLVPALIFGLAIPDTSLPDVHGSNIPHHQHGKRRSHDGTGTGSGRRDRSVSRNRKSRVEGRPK